MDMLIFIQGRILLNNGVFLIEINLLKISQDNVGVAELTMLCKQPREWLGPLTDSGIPLTKAMKCNGGKVVCGIQTNIMPHQGNGADDLGMVAFNLNCCSIGGGNIRMKKRNLN